MADQKSAAKPGKGQSGPASQEALAALSESYGLDRLVELGFIAREEFIFKNRLLLGACVLLVISFFGNIVQYNYMPEPKLLSELPDGRIRPVPTMDQPLLNQKEILGWAEKCVQKIYDLSYVDWQRKVQNETACLSDVARSGFVKSLEQIGILGVLNTENQGVTYAVPRQAVLKKGWVNEDGYYQWVVEVPYRISLDGRRRGSIEVKMIMLIKRVSLNWREDGIWVETYSVKPVSGGAK